MSGPPFDLALAPFIYHGRLHHAEEPKIVCRAGQQTAYGLWRVRMGTLMIVEEERDAVLRDRGVALCQPGYEAHLSPGTEVDLVVFDLVDRPRVVRDLGGRQPVVRIPAGATPQPSWQELLGMAVPIIVGATWQAEAVEVITRLRDNYWRDRHAHLVANAELHAWLACYLQDLAEAEGAA